MAKKTNNLSEARKHLDDFVSNCNKAKVLAHELGLAQSEGKMDHLSGETVLVAAKVHLDEAVNISGSDMKKAKSVALEAAEILRNHPIPQPFDAARAGILNAVDEFIRKGVTAVPPKPDVKGATPPTPDKGAAGPADSGVVNDIVARAEKLLSQKKYAEARKAAAELVKLAAEKTDTDLKKRAEELVEKIRAEQFRELEGRMDEENAKQALPDEKAVEEELRQLMEKESDFIGALKKGMDAGREEQEKILSNLFKDAKGDSKEIEHMKKILMDRLGMLQEELSKKMKGLPFDARQNVTIKNLPPKDFTELKVLFYDLMGQKITELNKFVIEWK